MMQIGDIIILGAGPAGLCCATAALARGKSVTIIDHARKPLRKVLIAGGGKANFTNKDMRAEHFFSTNPHFAVSALKRYTPQRLLELFAENSIDVIEKEHGQFFCKNNSQDMVNLLLSKANKATFSFASSIISVKKDQDLFVVTCQDVTFYSHSLVIATGNLAYPQIGATNLGLQLAKKFGHNCITPRPALCGFIAPKNWPFLGLSGISMNVSSSIKKHQQPKNNSTNRSKTLYPALCANNLSLLFTHEGISGPAALQTSLYYETGDTIMLDFLPTASFEKELTHKENSKLLLKTLLRKFFPERFIHALLTAGEIDTALNDKKLSEIGKAHLQRLASCIHSYAFTPQKNTGFKKAEVAKGGVDTNEISSKTFESKLCPRLFFCGEVLDVTGRLGGYNLHWAYASGSAAGEHA